MCAYGLPSVWTQKSTCHLIETHIRDQEELEGKTVPRYPCLWVNVSAVDGWAVLYHTEDTWNQNNQVGGRGWGCHPVARYPVWEGQVDVHWLSWVLRCVYGGGSSAGGPVLSIDYVRSEVTGGGTLSHP